MAYDFAIKTGYAPLEARVYVSWAGSSYQKRDSLNISELLHKALGLYREHQHPHEILARTKLFLHNDHSGFGESERFIKHEKAADSLVRLYPASRHIPYYYMARSFDAYYGQEAMGFHKGQMALALEFAQKAIGVSRERRNKSMETYAYLQEASIFLEQGKLAQAHQSLQMAERENHGDFSACNYYYAIIKYEYLSHPEVALYKEAEEIIDEAVHLSKRNVTRYYHDALKRKLEIYFLRNEKKDLLQISTKIDSLARKIYEDENKTSIVTNEVKYKTEILELQNQATQEQLKAKMYNNWVLSMSILALALISMYLLYLYREKNIRERKLRTANVQLEEQKKEIDHLLQLNNRTLYSKQLKISTIQDSIAKVAHEISGMVELDGTISANHLQGVEKKLLGVASNEGTWEEFKHQFEEIHPHFFKRLNELHPNLSINDLKHCSYILSNLKNKEVAHLINISPRSVETTRYRLKKKLGLSQGETLYHYLQHI